MFGSNALPAIIAVVLHTSGALGKLFSEVNENIDQKQIDGLRAVGASWLQRVRFAILPQVAPNYLSYMLLRLEINVRASAILGFVGAGGIGAELSKTLKWGVGPLRRRRDDLLDAVSDDRGDRSALILFAQPPRRHDRRPLSRG